MTTIADLHIQEEILPLFDFTHNDFARGLLISILKEPLTSTQDILLRQETLKGFIANLNSLKEYSYSPVDLLEVHNFLNNDIDISTSKKGFKLKLLLSEKERHQTGSSYIQLVLLFYKLHTHYLKRINTELFPEKYKRELQSINSFFTSINLSHYKELIREQRFKIRHSTELKNILFEKKSKGEIETFWKRYFLFEANLSISKGIATHGFSFPVFSETVLSFEEVYHPLLKLPVKNSFTTSNNVTLLTGPNMSGKSTFLKAVSLCVYLGHIGLGVPASNVEMPFFDNIFISINLNDNLLSGYSHFMTEVMNLKKVVLEAANGKKCFAVFDELFRGTNIEDAVEISSTTLKGLTTFKSSFFFISTHLQQLKETEEVKTKMIATCYVDCDMKNDRPVFTYQIKEGWSDLKVGRILFEKEGLNELLKSGGRTDIGTTATSKK